MGVLCPKFRRSLYTGQSTMLPALHLDTPPWNVMRRGDMKLGIGLLPDVTLTVTDVSTLCILRTYATPAVHLASSPTDPFPDARSLSIGLQEQHIGLQDRARERTLLDGHTCS